MQVIYPFLTASQTVGPYYHIGLRWDKGNILADERTPGKRITITGGVLDGNGSPVPDALVEVWQADGEGRYVTSAGAGFTGFGRAEPDANGQFEVVTIKPGRVAGPGGTLQAPHIAVTIFARGLLRHLQTRIYFADEKAANDNDPVLETVPEDRRHTLLAQVEDATEGRYRWDIVLCNGDETVFFQV